MKTLRLILIVFLGLLLAACALPPYKSKLKESPFERPYPAGYHKVLFYDDLAYIESLLPEDPAYGMLAQLQVTPVEINENMARRLLHEVRIKCFAPSPSHTNIQVYNDLFYVDDFVPYFRWALTNRGNAVIVPWVEGNTQASRATIFIHSAKYPGKILMRYYGMESRFNVFDLAEIDKIKNYGLWR